MLNANMYAVSMPQAVPGFKKRLAVKSSVYAAGTLLKVTPRIPILGFRSGGSRVCWLDSLICRSS